MNTKPKRRILLVDDDDATNFIHKIIVSQTNLYEPCIILKNGKEAYDFCLDSLECDESKVDLIVLDINMPVMSGWEFLDVFQTELAAKYKTKIIVITTSSNPDDKARALDHPAVSQFGTKPLTRKMIEDISEQFL